MNIGNITSRLILTIAMACALCGCGRSDTCIEADDFGFAKMAISSRYDASEIFGDQTAEITPWIDGGLILDGNPLYIEVKNFDTNPNDNVGGILSAWCPWYGDSDHDTTLTDFCARLNPCVVSSLCPTPAAISLPITNAPCLMTKGMGLYALLAEPGYDANTSIDTMSNPNPAKSVSLHMGNPHTDYRVPSMDNDGNIADAGGVLYDYENVTHGSTDYYNGKLYFKILDSFYEDNNGQYRVFIKSGVQNGGWDPISFCINIVQTTLFGSGSGNGTDYTGATGGGIIPGIYQAVAAQSGFVNAVQALLTLYIIFAAMGFLMGSIEMTQKELLDRVFKAIIITILIGPNSWNFFNQHIFIWFYEGTGFVINILYQVAASGPGSSNPLDFFFSEEIFIKLSALLLSSPTGWIFVAVYIVMLVYLVQIYFDAAVLYMTSLIMIGVLICIGPIFIALFLFEQTKSYFDNWLKQMMAYSIQMILVYAGILFMTMIIRNQVYNTLGFPTCSVQFPNVGGVTIFEWYFPQILSWSSNPELANIPIPKAHFESAQAVAAQAANEQVAAAAAALAQAQVNLTAANAVVVDQQALAQAQANALVPTQALTYQQAQNQVTMTAAALQAAETQVSTDNAALEQAQADQNTVNELADALQNFGISHTSDSQAQLNNSIIAAQNIVTQYLSAQMSTALGAYNATIAQVAADQIALQEAQIALGANDTQAQRDIISAAATQLSNDTIAQTTAKSSYNALSQSQAAINTALVTSDLAALSSAQTSGTAAQIAAAQAKLNTDSVSQFGQSGTATTIMSTAIANAKATLAADIAVAQRANIAAQSAVAEQVAASSTQSTAAMSQSAQAQAQLQQIASAQAALNSAESNISSVSASPSAVQAQAAAAVANAQAALNSAQAELTSANQSVDAAAASALGGFGFSSSTASSLNNTFCLPYQCTGERYPDLPFLDPNDPYESTLINQMRNGQIGDFGGIAIIVVCVYLMDHFNKTTVSMSKFLSNTQGNMGDSAKAAASAAGGLHSMAMAPVHAADKALGVSAAIKAKRDSVNKFFADAKNKLLDKPWADHKTSSLRSDAVSGGVSSVRKEAEKLSGMSHSEATGFNKNLKNMSYNHTLENLLKIPTSKGGIGMKHNVDAHLAGKNILSKLSLGKASDFKNIAAAELFSKDGQYANLKGKIDYSKLSKADAGKVDKLSNHLKGMLNDKGKQDKFADAYVKAYAHMSNNGVGFLGKRSSIVRSGYKPLSALNSKTKMATELFDKVRGVAGGLNSLHVAPGSQKGGARSTNLSAKNRAKPGTPPVGRTGTPGSMVHGLNHEQGSASNPLGSMPQNLANLKHVGAPVERTGTPNMQGRAKHDPFVLKNESLSNKLKYAIKLTEQEQKEMLETLKKLGFTEAQLSHVTITKKKGPKEISKDKLAGNAAQIAKGRVDDAIVTRSGPGGQGVSHPNPFKHFKDSLDMVNLNGTALTSRQKIFIHADLVEHLMEKGFTLEQISHMKVINAPQGSKDTPSEVGVAEQATIKHEHQGSKDVSEVSSTEHNMTQSAQTEEPRVTQSALSETTALGLAPGGVQVLGTLCIQIEMGHGIKGTMDITVGQGVNLIDVTQGPSSDVQPEKSKYDAPEKPKASARKDAPPKVVTVIKNRGSSDDEDGESFA